MVAQLVQSAPAEDSRLSDQGLSETFDDAAELYDRARPTYPPQLFDDLAELIPLAPGSRVLEIGCGTGQATVPLAERGYTVIAVERGPHLAAVARRNLSRFPSVHIIVSRFEEWPLPVEPFDVVLSATAFHWIDPAVRVLKAAAALRPCGGLATVATHHIAGGDEQFFAEVQTCYKHWGHHTPLEFRLPTAAEILSNSKELEDSGRFDPAVFRRYEWELSYSTNEYVELLLTYSDHRALEPDARSNLLSCISQLIDSRYRGRVRKRYVAELRVAHRRD